MKKDLQHTEWLKNNIKYDPDFGALYKKVRENVRQIGYVTKRGYITVCLHIFGKQVDYYAHQLAFMLYHGKWPEGLVDHIDGNKSNNKIFNLREVSPALNTKNINKSKANKTGVTGVRYRKMGEYEYYIATWYDLGGQLRQKSFSVVELGERVAFDSACKYREKMLDLMNQEGAGYTKRHGT